MKTILYIGQTQTLLLLLLLLLLCRYIHLGYMFWLFFKPSSGPFFKDTDT
jgi:hypothetical protein